MAIHRLVHGRYAFKKGKLAMKWADFVSGIEKRKKVGKKEIVSSEIKPTAADLFTRNKRREFKIWVYNDGKEEVWSFEDFCHNVVWRPSR